MDHICYLFPAVLVSDFTYEEIASDDETEEFNKWSVGDSTIGMDFNYKDFKNARRSLEIGYDSTERYAIRGESGSDLDVSSINNPYGVSHDGFNWYDTPSNKLNVGMWVNCEDDVYSDENNLLKFEMNGDSDRSTYWNSSIQHTDRWEWWDDTLDETNNVETFKLYFDTSAGTGSMKIDTIVLFNKSTSNIATYEDSTNASTNSPTNKYNWENGLGFMVTSYKRSGHNININGLILGDDYREAQAQLQAMETKGLSEHYPVEGPYPKYDSIKEYEKVKTYLFQSKSKKVGESGYNYDWDNIVVILTDVSINRQKKKPGYIPFSATLKKFSG